MSLVKTRPLENTVQWLKDNCVICVIYCLLSLTVVTVGFGRNATQVNESDTTFMMCVVKDRATTRPLQLQIQDQPNTALRSIGIFSLIPILSPIPILSISVETWGLEGLSLIPRPHGYEAKRGYTPSILVVEGLHPPSKYFHLLSSDIIQICNYSI